MTKRKFRSFIQNLPVSTASLAGVMLFFLLVGCGTAFQVSPMKVLDAEVPVNFKLTLTESDFNESRSVVVSVRHVEVRLKKGAQEVRVITARGLGPVDLLKLQNDAALSLAEFEVPDGVTVRQARVVLEGQGHYLMRKNGSVCELPAPGGQQAGIRISIPDSVTIEKGFGYELGIDLDLRRSVAFSGAAGCEFNPVIRLHSAERREIEGPNRVEEPRQPPQSVIPPGRQIEQQGWDEAEEVKLIPVVEPEELPFYFN
jgi:hypothetical protein